jgi:ABC-type multidrug transport system fused ATPase/permease subunit
MAARMTRRRPDGRYQVKVTTVRWRQRRQPVLVRRWKLRPVLVRSWKLRPWRPTRQQDEAMARIVFDQVSMAYPGGIQAIDGLSLEIGDGEFMVFVGPSGCGKTTALRSIAGLEQVTAGTVTVGDRIVNDLPPKDRDIAMVFQNYALYPHMTVAQNLAFGLSSAGRPSPRSGGGSPRWRSCWADRVPRPQAGRAVRRSAAAGGDGPGDRPGAAGVPHG